MSLNGSTAGFKEHLLYHSIITVASHYYHSPIFEWSNTSGCYVCNHTIVSNWLQILGMYVVGLGLLILPRDRISNANPNPDTVGTFSASIWITDRGSYGEC